MAKILEYFYYFGKLPSYSEFIGNYPPILKKLLDAWSVVLDERRAPKWQEKIFFALPNKSYSEFLVGVAWNSEDRRGRRYPFALYIKMQKDSLLPISPFCFYNFKNVTDIIRDFWNFCRSIDLNEVEIKLAQDSKIASLENRVLRTEDVRDSRATIPIKSAIRPKNFLNVFSLKEEWLRYMQNEALNFLKKRISKSQIAISHEFSDCLLYQRDSSFEHFIKERNNKWSICT